MLLEFMELGGMTGTPKGIIEKMVSAILVVIRPLAVADERRERPNRQRRWMEVPSAQRLNRLWRG